MDEFIRKSVNEYANGELVQGETQDADGINYNYTYKVVDEVGRKTLDEVIAYEDPRGNKEVKSGHEIKDVTNEKDRPSTYTSTAIKTNETKEDTKANETKKDTKTNKTNNDTKNNPTKNETKANEAKNETKSN